MHPLEDTQRRHLMLLSAGLCIASLLLAPLAARSSSAPVAQTADAMRVAGLPAAPPEKAHEEIAVNRDPFLADTPPPERMEEAQRSSSHPGDRDAVASTVQAGAPMNVPLPPNAGATRADTSDVPFGSVVTAIVTGERAQALIYEGSTSRIVVVGDEVEGRHIVSISAAGVHFDDGSTLKLAELP